jgi:hypothetical protein
MSKSRLRIDPHPREQPRVEGCLAADNRVPGGLSLGHNFQESGLSVKCLTAPHRHRRQSAPDRGDHSSMEFEEEIRCNFRSLQQYYP